MPYAENQGVRIHYQVHGEGPPLVLQHGFTNRLEGWEYFGYVAALQEEYRLILVDSRGHGSSDKPHDPDAYELQQRVGDVLAVLDSLGIDRAGFLGYSMGGWIGYGMAHYAPERLTSLIVGAAHPYREQSWKAFREIDGNDPEMFITALERVIGETVPPDLQPFILANDLQALTAAAQQRSDQEEIVPAIRVPFLLYAGDADDRYAEIRDYAATVTDADFVALPGLRHVSGYLRSDAVVPHVKSFLASVNG